GEHIVSVDIYHGNELTGLAVVEVEFDSLEAAASFVPPNWFGHEVTADQRYKNANLAKSGKPTS
ncbi:MAG: adenylate cyclase, partial [Negativicutes bacterium]|nr:adenylate cyclase [Negativicutes bacterium]